MRDDRSDKPLLLPTDRHTGHFPAKRIARRLVAALTAAGALFALSACGQQDQVEDTASDQALARTQRQVQQLDSRSVSFIGIGPFGGFLSTLESDARSTLQQVGYSVSYSSVNRKDHLKQVEQFDKALSSSPQAIILAPTQDTGWTGELQKAKKAHIPVIIVAHRLAKNEQKLATTFVGPSDAWAGRQAALYVQNLYATGLRSEDDQSADASPDGLNGVVLQGPIGQRQSEDRSEGWNSILARTPSIHVLSGVPGDWTQDTAYTTMAGLLAQYSARDLRFVFAQSDAMAIGAVRAISDAGKSGQIHVVSIDGTKAGLQAVINGQIDRSVEYNPLIGQKLTETVTRLLQDKKIPAEVTVASRVFDAQAARAALPTRQY